MRLIGKTLDGERGGEKLFTGIGFSVAAGGSLAVTGPNGSGKSTLLRIIAGLLRPAAGAVRIEGGGEQFVTVASACHYLGHANAMKPALTVAENLAFWQAFEGATKGTVGAALEGVGLDGVGHLPFGVLSAGQRRRVAIARLLLNHRPLWILDEPTAGLDRASEAQFTGVMQAHLADGGIIVAATHLPLGLDGAELMLGEGGSC